MIEMNEKEAAVVAFSVDLQHEKQNVTDCAVECAHGCNQMNQCATEDDLSCQVRIERQSIGQTTWERIIDDAVHIHDLNLVSHLKSGYKYQITLHNCGEDHSYMVLPPKLVADPSVSAYRHIGTFDVIQPAESVEVASSMWFTQASVTLMLLVATTYSWVYLRPKQYQNKVHYEEPPASFKSKLIETPLFDSDDEDLDLVPDLPADLGEFPECHDETGWQDIFDKIYGRTESKPQEEDEVELITPPSTPKRLSICSSSSSRSSSPRMQVRPASRPSLQSPGRHSTLSHHSTYDDDFNEFWET